MKISFNQAWNNARNLQFVKSGYGHYTISCRYRGKVISCCSNATWNTDELNDWWGSDAPTTKKEKQNFVSAYRALVLEILRKNGF